MFHLSRVLRTVRQFEKKMEQEYKNYTIRLYRYNATNYHISQYLRGN